MFASFRRLFARCVPKQSKKPITRFRPNVESLEDRCVPASLAYATYLGGDNSDEVTDIALDKQGNIYLAGRTDSSYFIDENQQNPTLGNAFVAKLDPTGTTLLYVYYLQTRAGNGGRYAIAVDDAGCAYITGFTAQTTNFATTGAAQTTYGGLGDVFVAKLNAAGTGLVYCTYVGGDDIEDVGIGTQEGSHSIAVDADGNAYITGYTQSTNFPTVNPLSGQNQKHLNAGADGFITKINAAGSQILFSTYLGGNQNAPGENGATFTNANAITLDSAANVYVTGVTQANDFPTTMNAFDSTKNGDHAVFVTKLSTTTSTILYSTFLGGTGDGDGFEGGYDIAVDSAGNILVTGETSALSFPIKNAFVSVLGNNSPGLRDAFLTKLNPNNTGNAQLIFSTYIGGSATEEGFGLDVDSSGNIYVTGRTNSQNNFPKVDPLPNNNPPAAGGFIAKFSPSGKALLCSYIGGGAERGQAVAVNGFGDIIFVGRETGTFLPTTANALQPDLPGAESGYLAIIKGGSTSFKGVDADGDTYTVSLTGPGQLSASLNDNDGDGKGAIKTINLRNTNPSTTVLTVSVTKVGDGFVDIGSILGPGLKEIAATKSHLVGPGVNLTGRLGTLKIRDILNGADVLAAGSASTTSVIKAHVIGDGTTINIGSGLSTLKAARIGAATILAPRITTLTITGDSTNSIAGDFGADVTLTGTGTVLNTVTIANQVIGADIAVQLGSVGIFTAKGFVNSDLFLGQSGNLTSNQKIQELTITGTTNAYANSNISAAIIGKVILASVDTDNSNVTFGVHGHTITRVKVKNIVGAVVDATHPPPLVIDDFEVDLV